ncbi:hypothetical protein Pmani_001783 [Petrolisthes manimaculis]|uniref:Uncharacterized protein n=1 Tax=Petrolisthes manimaculis TaxID=1843537 RepID=A0AAE1UP39_9EUCA|nr:hypothetical protein Pmani_002470 [Petrolisthes manimaculis]KAK4327741.1 hypothetical protein Pmani_001783 [Petrolisthes manimaculis]
MANALEKSDAVVKGGDYNNDHGSSMALLVEGGNRDDGVQERLLVEATVQMIRKQLFGCHLVLASTNKQSSFFSSIVRELIGRGVAAGVVVSGETLSQSPTNNAQSYKHHRKRAGLWQGGEATCKVLIFDYTTNDTYTAKR